MTDSDNQPPSKRAREAAADLGDRAAYWTSNEVHQAREGQADSDLFVQSFAQFERTLLDEIKARVRGLKITQSQVDQAMLKAFDRAPNTAEIHNAAIDEALAAIDTIQQEQAHD